MKHSNPFICLSEDNDDEDNKEAITVKSDFVSTTCDEINNDKNIGMNDDAFYTSADLDQQPQLPDLLQHHCTPVDLATSALLEINHTVGPEFEENHHQQPPAPPSWRTSYSNLNL